MIDTRARLLRATRRCIASKGLAGTTSREIAAMASVNLAAITYHFGSREGLLTAILVTMGLDAEFWNISWIVGIPWLGVLTAAYFIRRWWIART